MSSLARNYEQVESRFETAHWIHERGARTPDNNLSSGLRTTRNLVLLGSDITFFQCVVEHWESLQVSSAPHGPEKCIIIVSRSCARTLL